MKVVHIDKFGFGDFFHDNKMSGGTAKNGTRYAEVVVNSEIYHTLKNGLTIIGTHKKNGSTRTYEFNGEHGREFYNYHAQLVVRFYGKMTDKKLA
ncbi:hypothetical protein LU293_04100 [Moraxella nasovis]|uniref:hypothetical protein n=1 Tax=Moraxella nasovis TaxID=2904121 RepID=UPI001F6106AF|nr:hypothetical protein [Moraxella nasovis]UNU74084.1 hypothetical protein LU293_04100 [Moraxella nasovis]